LKEISYHVTSPGRVNLLGEHVDYNDGLVLPAAIDRSVHMTATRRNDGSVKLSARDFNETIQFKLDNLKQKIDNIGSALPDWALYPAGVAWSLQQQGLFVSGLNCEFTSNIPIGAGLSSSAAVEVGFAVLWQALGGWELDRLTLARYCQQAENEYVGVNCGLMDQFACANGVKDHAVLLDTRSLEFKAVPLPPGTAIVIADSKIRRSLVNSAYNNRRQDCETAVSILHSRYSNIRSLRDVTPAQFFESRDRMPESVFRHSRHVVEEIQRVNQAMQFLENGNAVEFGKLMFETHNSLRDFFEVSCKELDILVEIAHSLKGCIGARLTGAGYGGCTVNLVKEDYAQEFVQQLNAQYKQRTSLDANVFVTHASAGAEVSIIN
jgi:galactokinase